MRWSLSPARVFAALFVGLIISLLSTFVGERSAMAVYPDVMGCETGCRVVATGWPLVFVRDYTGMSVVNTADVLEVWAGGDRLDRLPFGLDVLFWTVLCLLLLGRTGRSG